MHPGNHQEPIPLDYKCKCKFTLMQLTAWTPTNPCRRYLVCPNRYKHGVKKCNKFYWIDDELNEWYRSHLYGMYTHLHHPQQVQQEIDNGDEEMVQLQAQCDVLQADLSQARRMKLSGKIMPVVPKKRRWTHVEPIPPELLAWYGYDEFPAETDDDDEEDGSKEVDDQGGVYVPVGKSAGKKTIMKSPTKITGVVIGLASTKKWEDFKLKFGKRPAK